MQPLTAHIQNTVDCIDALLDGWTQGRLVIEDGQVYLQVEDGRLIPVPAGAILEVKNGSIWQRLTLRDLAKIITGGWPAYAGLTARMK